MRAGAISAAALLLLGAACDPLQYGDFEDEAPVLVIEAPDGYGSAAERFGRALASYDGTFGGAEVSRLAVTAGPASPYLVYEAWNGTGVSLGAHLLQGCDDVGDCDESAGTALVGFQAWRPGTPVAEEMCVLITAPGTGGLVVRCESGAGTTETIAGPTGVSFGAAAAPLGVASDVGVAVIGAPGADGNAGGVFRQPNGDLPVPIALPAGTAPPTGRLGAVLAAAGLSVGRALVAASAPDAGRVVVFELLADGTANVRACIDEAAGGFGGALALGDLDGDGLPELIVGNDPGSDMHAAATVEVYAGTGLPPGGCVSWDTPPTTLVCPDGLRDIDCADSGFGRSLAVGDVDADGDGDLLVGAPFARVDNEDAAGAVYLFEGGDLSDLAPTDVLTHSSPEADDRLGVELTVVATDLGPGGTRRAEPVAASPGRQALLVFLCTALDGDGPTIGDRCLPR